MKKTENDYLPRKEKYEKYNEGFRGRNSFSKTDKDATFMRMKGGHMLNGQPKPGYNIQAGTENRFVVGYDIFPNPTDTRTFIPHMEDVRGRPGVKFGTIIADAGYGSEENCGRIGKNGSVGAVKYGTCHKEQKRSFRKKTYNAENWEYDRERKQHTCPAGNPVPLKKTVVKKNESGFERTVDVYQCDNCEGCPYRNLCTKSEYGRMVQGNENWLSQKEKVKQILHAEKYHELLKRRPVECETIFGQTKGKLGFRRFKLRGNEKVSVEWGLLMIGQNVKELRRQAKQQGITRRRAESA